MKTLKSHIPRIAALNLFVFLYTIPLVAEDAALTKDPFTPPPTAPLEYYRIPTDDSKEHVIVSAHFVKVNSVALRALAENIPEFQKYISSSFSLQVPSNTTHLDANSILKKLASTEGVEIVSTPRLHGRLGKEFKFSEGSELIYPASWIKNPDNPEELIPKGVETRHLGLECTFLTTLQPERKYAIQFNISQTKLAGFIHISTGETYQGDWQNSEELMSYYPVFASRAQNNSVALSLGESIILGGILTEEIKKEREGDEVKTDSTLSLMILSLEKYENPF